MDEAAHPGSEPSDPREFLLEMRRRALSRKGLRTHQEEAISLEHLIRTTRALVSTTEEIWERCAPHYCGRVSEEEAIKGTCLFVRVAPSTVKASTSSKHKNTLVLRTALEVTKRDFYLPVAFPTPLNRLVPVPKVSRDEAMPNLSLLLKRSMLLSEEILVAFLMEYKYYMEQLQVALGEVDAWILEGIKCEEFLHGHFGANGQPDHFVKSFNNQLVPVDPIQNVPCSRCCKKFYKHDKKLCWAFCLGGKDLSGNELANEDFSSRGCPAYFPVAIETNLLVCKLHGLLELDFAIDQHSERARMAKFLAFVSSESDAEEDVGEDEAGNAMREDTIEE